MANAFNFRDSCLGLERKKTTKKAGEWGGGGVSTETCARLHCLKSTQINERKSQMTKKRKLNKNDVLT